MRFGCVHPDVTNLLWLAVQAADFDGVAIDDANDLGYG